MLNEINSYFFGNRSPVESFGQSTEKMYEFLYGEKSLNFVFFDSELTLTRNPIYTVL